MDPSSIELQKPDSGLADSEQGLWRYLLAPLSMRTKLEIADFVDAAGFFHDTAGSDTRLVCGNVPREFFLSFAALMDRW